MKKKNKLKEIQIKGTTILPACEDLPTNENIQTLYSDIVNIFFSRGSLGHLSFFSRTVGKNVEQCRVVVPYETLKDVVTLICNNIDYYPQKPETKK